ncbi:phosphotransferase [Lignipirellula cremea]|uniref:Homoserine kinase n=1 Tax=Lignipirellula cremea TaxID=2528010 RepID=A0A518E112_9BACT|nr:phosphotransferase [Lignipirellula cremea]QDU97780.1 homoserine kinase [Lignipirellula cremea]
MLSEQAIVRLLESRGLKLRGSLTDEAPSGIIFRGSSGGLSGAQFWRLETEQGPYCLRLWPAEHPTAERLAWIHAVLQRAASAGFTLAPVPLADTAGRTFAAQQGRLCQLEPWMPGEALPVGSPSAELVADACQRLAEFHQAVQPPLQAAPVLEESPGILLRTERLASLQDPAVLAGYRHALSPRIFPAAYLLASRYLELAPQAFGGLLAQLAPARSLRVPLQPCIRDVWRDNLLVEGDRLSGLVDFGAMNLETPAADVARLLGSLALDDAALWQAGLAAYQAVRPLAAGERQLIAAFDRSLVVLGGFSWLDWIYLEQREFAEPARVLARLAELLLRLETNVLTNR